MEDDSQFGRLLKWGLGAVGLGVVAAVVVLPKAYALWVILAIILLFLLLFGAYFLWRRLRAKDSRSKIRDVFEGEKVSKPGKVSDPNALAKLKDLRQKFESGLEEFEKAGKNLYDLPWYVIIGESGGGKTEALRAALREHIPAALSEHIPGPGGTINMNWWFTKKAIILDTAGKMVVPEAGSAESPEWKDFLRLLKKNRPHCPINGLFLVLSVESLIRDSAEEIRDKSIKLAQQMELIQRTLDVRFPVYLLVTKCDLLVGFREFFDSIEDPLLQHQIFGWSNPDPLDAPLRPELVQQHLEAVADRLRRRRSALLRSTSGTGRLGDTSHFFAANYQLGRGPAPPRRLDEVDGLFALPESILRLAPRLRRYLEAIFAADDVWAKPVFLRGIYFTSSMREGKALDEASAALTGLSVDQLADDRNWEKNRAFFHRDLYFEKVFNEKGLVTRATNTMQLLRKRQMLIFGTATLALLLVLVFGFFAKSRLEASVRSEAQLWKTGASGLKEGTWEGGTIVSQSPSDPSHFIYAGTNVVDSKERLTLLQFHQRLKDRCTNDLDVSWIFKPMAWLGFGRVSERPEAQRLLFETSVLRPLVENTRMKLTRVEPPPASLVRHREALLALIKLQADGLNPAARRDGPTGDAAAEYIKSFLAYLTDQDLLPDPTLSRLLAGTYSKDALKRNKGVWPPDDLVSDLAYTNNLATILAGLENFQKASKSAQTNIHQQLGLADKLSDKLEAYRQSERAWLTTTQGQCASFSQTVSPSKTAADEALAALENSTNSPTGPISSLSSFYSMLADKATNASAAVLSAPVEKVLYVLPAGGQAGRFTKQVRDKLKELASGAADEVWSSFNPRAASLGSLDTNYLARANHSQPSYQSRWALYAKACDLRNLAVKPDASLLGVLLTNYNRIVTKTTEFQQSLAQYSGPFGGEVSNACTRVAGEAVLELQRDFLVNYETVADKKLSQLAAQTSWNLAGLQDAGEWLGKINHDLTTCNSLPDEQKARLAGTRTSLETKCTAILESVKRDFGSRLGFPVGLNAGPAKNAGQVRELKDYVLGVKGTLGQEAWAVDHSGTLAAVRANCDLAGRVVSALVATNGGAARFQLFFVPPADSEPQEDKDIPRIFKVVEGSNGKRLNDLSKGELNDPITTSLGDWPMDAPMKISFADSIDAAQVDQQPFSRPAWALIDMIRDGSAVASDEQGTKWRFKVKLTRGSTTGNITFEARLEPQQALPKRDDWLKLK